MGKLNNNLNKLNSAILEFASDIKALSNYFDDGRSGDYGYTLFYSDDYIIIENIDRSAFNFYELTAIELIDGCSIDDLNDFLKDIK